MANKVQFGLSNVWIATLAFDENNDPVYGIPHRLPGAVNLTLDTSGSTNPFYADNIIYYQASSNQGYTGTLEMALLDEWMRLNILNEVKDQDGVLIENANASTTPFALLYQVEGDQKSARRALYNVKAERTGETAATKTDSTEVQTTSLPITVSPLPNSMDVKAATTSETSPLVFNEWFQSVHLRNGTATGSANLASLTMGSAVLEPAFNPQTLTYTAQTANATNTITATAEDADATITITVNGSTIENGTAATWEDGENSVVIQVVNGTKSQTYGVTVTKTES